MTGIPIRGKATGSCGVLVTRPFLRKIEVNQDCPDTIPRKRKLFCDLPLRHTRAAKRTDTLLYSQFDLISNTGFGWGQDIHTVGIPRPSQQYSGDVRLADSKHGSDPLTGKDSVKSVDGLNLHVRELPVLSQMRRWRQALKVLRVNTPPILAAMMNMPATRNRSMYLLVREAMGVQVMGYAAIPVGHVMPGPVPASGIDVNIVRKFEFTEKGAWSRIGMHLGVSPIRHSGVPCLGELPLRRGLSRALIIPQKPYEISSWEDSGV